MVCFVQELLKLATLLYSASRVEEESEEGGVGVSGLGDDEAEPPLTSQVMCSTDSS